MNITTSSITKNQIFAPVIGHESVNSDFVLPDYFPDINKIICYNLTPSVEEITTTEGKISISGVISVNMLYMNEENKISDYKTILKYTKIFQSDAFDENICVNATQEILSESIRATGPKRININATIEIRINIIKNEKLDYVSSIDERHVEFLCKEKKILNINSIKHKILSVKDSIDLPQGASISHILRSDCNLIIKEKKVIKGKIYINGEFCIKIIYLSEECKADSFTSTVPVSEVIDAAGAKDNDLCFVSDIKCSCIAELLNNDYDKSQINLDICTSLIFFTANCIEFSCFLDAFATNGKICTELNSISLTENINEHRRLMNFSIEKKANENISEIIDIYPEQIAIGYDKQNNKNIIILNIKYKMLTISPTGEYNVYTDKYSYEFDTGISPDNTISVSHVYMTSCNALQQGNGNITINFEIQCEFLESYQCKEDIITAIRKSSDDTGTVNCSIILYFAQKNENIWNIAKNNRVSVELITSINNIQENILSEDKMLVLPKI